jgi:hypothetical protein
MLADRSRNEFPFIAVGELDVVQMNIGSEMHGLAGFSTNNYIYQAYNSALDFGTADCWFKFIIQFDTPAGGQYLYNRRKPDGSGNHTYITISSLGKINFRLLNSGDAEVNGTKVLSDGKPHFVLIRRISGVAYLEIDGVNDVSAAQAQDMDITDAYAFLGVDALQAYGKFNGDFVSQFSCGLGTVTDDMAKKMYDDLKPLLEPGAMVSLVGNSDDVLGIDYQDKTNKMNVLTSNGISRFEGLKMVDFNENMGDRVPRGKVVETFVNDSGKAGRDLFYTRYESGVSNSVQFDVKGPDSMMFFLKNLSPYYLYITGNVGQAHFSTYVGPFRHIVSGLLFGLSLTGYLNISALGNYDNLYEETGDAYFNFKFCDVVSFNTGFDFTNFAMLGDSFVNVNENDLMGFHKPDIDFYRDLEETKKELLLAQQLPQEFQFSSGSIHTLPPGWYPIEVFNASSGVRGNKSGWSKKFDGFQWVVNLGAAYAPSIICRRIQY